MLQAMVQKLFLITILIISTATVVGLLLYQKTAPGMSALTANQNILIEEIPGSAFHSPDGTWWGYNQTKIVRFKDYVFSYYIDNKDSSPKTVSQFTLLKKHRDDAWEQGASVPTSRPGNILVDSAGVLHAFVFEPINAANNDSWGKLMHYSFPHATSGDIKTFTKEIVINNTGKQETVNIRVGAAIDENDTMALGFGLPFGVPPYTGQSEHLYTKKPHEPKWQHHIVAQNLGHDFYYPFVVGQNNAFHLLPLQDDFADDGNPATYDNIYQKINLFSFIDNQWKNIPIADLSRHPLASRRPRLLEQEDFWMDTQNTIHGIYKEFLDPQHNYKATAHRHVKIGSAGTQEETINPGQDSLNWIRLFEVQGELYYFASSFDAYYWKKVGANEWSELAMPADAKGMYPYLATARSGSRDKEYIDILLLASDSKTYEDGTQKNYYVRIPAKYFDSK